MHLTHLFACLVAITLLLYQETLVGAMGCLRSANLAPAGRQEGPLVSTPSELTAAGGAIERS